MSLEKNKAIIRGLFEAFNKHNLGLLDSFIAPDFVDHTLQLQGLDGFKKFEAMFIKSFPDYSETIEDIIAEGDMVWVHFKVTGTHTGEWSFFWDCISPYWQEDNIHGCWHLVYSQWKGCGEKVCP